MIGIIALSVTGCKPAISDEEAKAILEGVESYESSEAYDNARAALALYDAAYAVYNARISGANINISATLKLIGSMRDPAEIDNVIAIMLTEMKK